jgi:hypothetical protein
MVEPLHCCIGGDSRTDSTIHDSTNPDQKIKKFPIEMKILAAHRATLRFGLYPIATSRLIA